LSFQQGKGRPMPPKASNKGFLWLLPAACLIGLDQLSKAAALSCLHYGEAVPVTGFFNLVLAFNPGAAFSFLAGAGGWQKWLFAALAAGVSAWIIAMFRSHPKAHAQNAALMLVLSGALGNLADRLVRGAVVDFLDFYWHNLHWPAFNLADTCICLGAAGLALIALFPKKNQEPA
jgi:signal peptidase II